MSREIKFRAFENETARCRMFQWDEIKNGFISYLNSKDTSVMQYTGMKDMNGTEIYEGDIIRWTSCNPFSIGEIRTAQVDYVQARYWCFSVKFGCYLAELLANERCEVVGNIHESPELL